MSSKSNLDKLKEIALKKLKEMSATGGGAGAGTGQTGDRGQHRHLLARPPPPGAPHTRRGMRPLDGARGRGGHAHTVSVSVAGTLATHQYPKYLMDNTRVIRSRG